MWKGAVTWIMLQHSGEGPENLPSSMEQWGETTPERTQLSDQLSSNSQTSYVAKPGLCLACRGSCGCLLAEGVHGSSKPPLIAGSSVVLLWGEKMSWL